MISKKERFTTSDLAATKKQKNKKIVSPIGFFVVYMGSEIPKKSIIVSKKVFKTAVSRNKYKRLFFNSVKEIQSLKNKSFIFYPKKVFTKEELLSAFTFI